MVAVPNYTLQLRRQISDFVNKGCGIQTIINYLLTCDFEAGEIISMLTAAPFSFDKEMLLYVLENEYVFETEV